jgi:hypothetical protein
MSRVYQVTTPMYNTNDDSDDDEGIITVDPVTHQTSIMRINGQSEAISKDSLDRLDGRNTGHRFSAHRGSVGPSSGGSGQYPVIALNKDNQTSPQQHLIIPQPPAMPSNSIVAGQYATFTPTIGSPAINQVATLNTTPPPPGTTPPTTDPNTSSTERQGRAAVSVSTQDDVIGDIFDLGAPTSNNARRPSFTSLRSPSTMRSESVLRTSVRHTSSTNLLGTDPGTPTGSNASEMDVYSPTGSTVLHLPSAIDIDVLQENFETPQQPINNLLQELNYHYPYAVPAAPVTATQQSRMISDFNKNSSFSSHSLHFNTAVDDLISISSSHSSVGSINTPQYNLGIELPHTDNKTNKKSNNGSYPLQNTLKSPSYPYTSLADEKSNDCAELDELNAILQAANAIAQPTQQQQAHIPNQSSQQQYQQNYSISPLQYAIEVNNQQQLENSQPLLDREQFQLASYAYQSQQYAQISTQSNSQLPSVHTYTSIFVPSIYPLHPPLQQMLSTYYNNPTNVLYNLGPNNQPSMLNGGSIPPPSSTTTSNFTSTGTLNTLLPTRQKYTWIGSHHRHALKKRRVQVLRFALNETQYQNETAATNQQQQRQQQQQQNGATGQNGTQNGTPGQNGAHNDESEDEFDENLLSTHLSGQIGKNTTIGVAIGPHSLVSSPHNNNNNNNSAQGTSPTTALKSEVMSETEFTFQQKNARKLMARTIVPAPNELILNDPADGVPSTNNQQNIQSSTISQDKNHLPLPYSVSGVASLTYLSKQLDARTTKEIVKGKNLLSTLTAAYKDDNPPPATPDSTAPPQPPTQPQTASLFNMNRNKKIHNEMGGVSSTTTSMDPFEQDIHDITQQTTQQQVTNMMYTQPLKSILVNRYTEQQKHASLLGLNGMQQYEELCKRRMRQGCFVIKYKRFVPTKRFLYLSHNDTMLTWRELTSAEERKFDLWDSMNEEWKECAVMNEMMMNHGNGGKLDDEDEYGSDFQRPETPLGNFHDELDEVPEKQQKEPKKPSRWSSFLTSNTTFKSNKHVPIDDIKQIFYGPFVGIGFQPFVEECRKSNAKPWYATTIQAQSETLNIVFLCNYDVTLWLQGLYMLAPSTGKAFTLGKMLWLRLIMKINFVGYNDFVFGGTAQQLQQQQQFLQQHSLLEDPSNTNSQLAPNGSNLDQNGLNQQQNGSNGNKNEQNNADQSVSRSFSRSTPRGSVQVANLNPNTGISVNGTGVPQIYLGANKFDWTEKVSQPGSNDLSRYTPKLQ